MDERGDASFCKGGHSLILEVDHGSLLNQLSKHSARCRTYVVAALWVPLHTENKEKRGISALAISCNTFDGFYDPVLWTAGDNA